MKCSDRMLKAVIMLTALFGMTAVVWAMDAKPLAEETVETLRTSGKPTPKIVDELVAGWRDDAALTQLLISSVMDDEILWRMARSNVNLGENLDEKEAKPYYEQALKQAEQAVERGQDNADAHLMLAISSGRMALLRGPFKAAGLVKRAHKHALKAAALNDSIPVALYVLGRTHKNLMAKSGLARRIAGLTFADNDSVAWYFEKALAISQGNMIQCRVEYADFLLNTRKDFDGARKMLREALLLKPRDEQDVPAQKRARKMMEEIEK